MFTLYLLYRRAPWPLRLLGLAVLLIVFASTIIRTFKATQQIQERNNSVHAHHHTH